MKGLQPTTDKFAIGLSLLCMLHCLALPMAATLLPVVMTLPLEDERFHQLLLLGILPTSVIALMLGCRRHKVWIVLFWGTIGLFSLIMTALFGHEILGDFGEKVAVAIGSGFIIYSHFKNYRLCNKHQCECQVLKQ